MKLRDNQQERSFAQQKDLIWLNKIKSKTDWIWFIVGFSDGEGSINVSFKKRLDYKCGWKIVPVFNISQKEKAILARIKQFFGCGTLRDRKDGVYYYEVENQIMLKSRIIPFFEKYPFKTEKKLLSFQYFVKILKILEMPNWDSYENLVTILDYRDKMIVKRPKKYSNDYILKQMKSSETICQKLDNQLSDDIVQS